MIRVLIVDDSAVVRKTLTEKLSTYAGIEVVGAAVDPYVARDKIVRLRPDVITLDLEMPRMDGLSFHEKLMEYYPLPVIIVSSLTGRNSQLALKALELGALEVVTKPELPEDLPEIGAQLARAIRSAAATRIRSTKRLKIPAPPPPPAQSLRLPDNKTVIAIGASAGGTKAIEVVLSGLPKEVPGIVIVQHMPEMFTSAFAERLNRVCSLTVREARDRDIVSPGVALIAPGGNHMVLQRSGSKKNPYLIRIKDGPAVHHQRPSVDVLFQSVARAAGSDSVGVLLTGMGVDGASGLLEMRGRGAVTLAQDEETSLVFGMPGEAIKLGAVDHVIPLQRVALRILRALLPEKAERKIGA